MLQDEGQDTIDASAKWCSIHHSADGLWIEPHWRPKAGTRRSTLKAARCRFSSTVGISGLQAGEDVEALLRNYLNRVKENGHAIIDASRAQFIGQDILETLHDLMAAADDNLTVHRTEKPQRHDRHRNPAYPRRGYHVIHQPLNLLYRNLCASCVHS